MKIEAFYLTKKYIEVTTEEGDYIPVNREEYEEWVVDNDKKDWLYVIADHAGEPQENYGTMSWEEYWRHSDILKDLQDYIIKNKLKAA